MMKKKTWNAGCMILISLMICTILSIRIEKWMQIPVEIATISQTEEEKLLINPLVLKDVRRFQVLQLNI